MLSKNQLSLFRNSLFRHLDGIAVTPTAFALHQRGVTTFLLDHQSCDLETITQAFGANDGYLNVALRMLCSQGWLTQEVDNEKDTVRFTCNENSAIAFEHFSWYQEAVELLQFSGKFHSRKFEQAPFLKMEHLFHRLQNNFGVSLSEQTQTRRIQEQILAHIEGIIVGPTTVLLGMSGMFHKYFMETRFKPEEFHEDAQSLGRLLDIFVALGWFDKKNETYAFTEKGFFFAKRASAYGVTVSYLPLFRQVETLIFDNPTILKTQNPGEPEKHVDRTMNVWGSGGAHNTYFKIIDEIILDLFNKPIQEQPKGILDMGCGNGAFLAHLYNVIENQTERGKILDAHPLIMIGVDYNEAALKSAKATLISNDIWAKVIWGDIGNPDQLARDLKENYDITLEELLNVRTFLDHNRIWETPAPTEPLSNSASTGAYATEGKRINNNLVATSLRLHFQKWVPYVKKFGLILIELHTLDPERVAKHIGKTAITAYDATHGFSDQYILELEEFLAVLESAGLAPEKSVFRKFPNSELATVSINLFKGKS